MIVLWIFLLVLLHVAVLAGLLAVIFGLSGNFILLGLAVLVAWIGGFASLSWTTLLLLLGLAVVGEIVFKDGRHGSVVLVAPRNNAKGATLVLPDPQGGKPEMHGFLQGMEQLFPQDIVQILAMQERLFGDGELPRPEGFSVVNR